MPASHHVSRRIFIKSSAATAVACGVWSGRAAGESNSPNEKLQIAVIGTANRAAANINGVRGEAIVAMCDVDNNYLHKAQSEFPDAKSFTDYRELIDQAGDRIDAVVVSTPDHHHAPATIRAIRAGLHVYCEKPLTHTVEEARLVTEAARARGVVTQLGTQIHAGDNYRRVVEMIRAGIIGDVGEVYVWVGKGWGGRGNDLPTKAEIQTPPEALSWEHWLGPAPRRPFAPGRYHPAQWRRWWQFGGGTLGDMACHYMDLPFWALDLKYPTSCKATGPELDPETCPTGITVEYEFPARQQRPPVKLTWHDGDNSLKKISGQRVPGSGVMFVGSAGKVFADYNTYRIFPPAGSDKPQLPEPTIPSSIGHHAEWIKACKDGSPTTCNFDYSGPLTEAVLLGNISYRTGQKLDWDAKQLQAVNCPAADYLIRKTYRPGWEVA
jgi:predicted dehydrogenase